MSESILIGAAVVAAGVLLAIRRHSESDVVLSAGNDEAKAARMAERAREYEQKYGTREGNYTV